MTDTATGPGTLPAPEAHGRTLAACLALAVLYLALRLPGLLGNSATYDEPIYVGASMQWTALADDRAAAMLYHPPLAYHLIDLPLRFLDAPIEPWDPRGASTQTGLRVLYETTFSKTSGGARVDPHTILVLARLPILLVGALGMVFLFALGRRLGGRPAGWLAAALWAGFPEAASQSIQATTDCVAAVAAFGLALAAVRHLEAVRDGAPVRRSLTVLGLATGAALLAKHSLLPHVAVVFAALALCRTLSVRRLAAVAGIAALVVWTGYSFEVHPAVRGDGEHATLDRVAESLGFAPATLESVARSVPLPAPTYLRSVLDALFSKTGARTGTPWTAYMAGEWSDRGFLSYFPYAIFVKTPFAVLGATVIGMAGLAALLRERRRETLLVLALFALPFALAVQSRLNIGFRHLLPTLPFLVLVGLAGLVRLGGEWTSRRTACVAVLLSAEAFRTIDDPICFSSLGSRGLHLRLADSNLEVGQDLDRLREWARANGVRSMTAVLHGPPGLYEREAARDSLFRRFDISPSGGLIHETRPEDQTGPIPPDGLLAVGESVVVLPRWRKLLEVPPLARVHRTWIYVPPRR